MAFVISEELAAKRIVRLLADKEAVSELEGLQYGDFFKTAFPTEDNGVIKPEFTDDEEVLEIFRYDRRFFRKGEVAESPLALFTKTTGINIRIQQDNDVAQKIKDGDEKPWMKKWKLIFDGDEQLSEDVSPTYAANILLRSSARNVARRNSLSFREAKETGKPVITKDTDVESIRQDFINYLKEENDMALNDLEKAKLLLANRKVSLKDVSEQTGVSYSRVKLFSSRPGKMRTARWDSVHAMAEMYDALNL